MAIGLIMTFDGGTEQHYEAVMGPGHLDLTSPGNPGASGDWPDGLVSHHAGPTPTGWAVVDVWESQEQFDRFLQGRLQAAMQANEVPEPNVVAFRVHNAHTAGVAAG